MRVLIDTNVLLRSVRKSDPNCRIARAALLSLYAGNHALCITPQNVAEFWNVCTRPADVNGYGFTIAEVARYIDQMERIFTILPENFEAFRAWRRLVEEHQVRGAKVHDARLAAMMTAYGISRLLTFNIADFSRYPSIEAVHPANIA